MDRIGHYNRYKYEKFGRFQGKLKIDGKKRRGEVLKIIPTLNYMICYVII